LVELGRISIIESSARPARDLQPRAPACLRVPRRHARRAAAAGAGVARSRHRGRHHALRAPWPTATGTSWSNGWRRLPRRPGTTVLSRSTRTAQRSSRARNRRPRGG